LPKVKRQVDCKLYLRVEPRDEFTEQSLAFQVLLDNKANDKAIPVLIRLENEADFFSKQSFCTIEFDEVLL
jgi:hypothetical protein